MIIKISNIKISNLGFIFLFIGILFSYVVRNNTLCETGECRKLEILLWSIYIFILPFSIDFKWMNQFTITREKLFLYLSFFLNLVFWNWENLSAELVADHLYHIQEALGIYIKLADNYCNINTELCNTIPFKFVIDKFSTFSAIIGLLIVLALSQIRNKFFLSIVSVFVFLQLGSYLDFTGLKGGDIHPPLRLLPLWISSAILGYENYVFRICGLVAIPILGVQITSYFKNEIGWLSSILLGFSIISIPLLQHVGYIVEPSIWTSLAWTGMLVFLQFGKKDRNQFQFWFIVISLASLMRASAFMGLIPLILFYIWEEYKIHKFKILIDLKFYKAFLPILVMIPFLIKTLKMGTSATDGSMKGMQAILKSLESGLSIKLAYYAIMLPWLIFFPLGFYQKSKSVLIKSFFYVIFFVLSYSMFYSINEGLWGLSRYQSEFVLPFCILGFIQLFLLIQKININVSKIFLFLIIIINIYISFNFQKFSQLREENLFSGLRDGRTAGISEIVYNRKEALDYAKFRSKLNQLYIDGILYGPTLQILYGVNYDDLTSIRSIGFPWGGMKPEDINSSGKINLVVFSDWEPNQKKIEYLLNNNWYIVKIIENYKYNSSSVLMRRNLK